MYGNQSINEHLVHKSSCVFGSAWDSLHTRYRESRELTTVWNSRNECRMFGNTILRGKKNIQQVRLNILTWKWRLYRRRCPFCSYILGQIFDHKRLQQSNDIQSWRKYWQLVSSKDFRLNLLNLPELGIPIRKYNVLRPWLEFKVHPNIFDSIKHLKKTSRRHWIRI
jgi:hypothetical protein